MPRPRKSATADGAAPAQVLPIAETLDRAAGCAIATAETFAAKLKSDPSLRRWLIGMSISIIFTLAGQTATMFYWAGTITNRVQALEKSVDRMEVRLDNMDGRR
jgi:hypothetical protein